MNAPPQRREFDDLAYSWTVGGVRSSPDDDARHDRGDPQCNWE